LTPPEKSLFCGVDVTRCGVVSLLGKQGAPEKLPDHEVPAERYRVQAHSGHCRRRRVPWLPVLHELTVPLPRFILAKTVRPVRSCRNPRDEPRDACLKQWLFAFVREAREVSEAW